MKLLPIVKEIEGSHDRLATVKKLLKQHKITYRTEKYDTGTNILIGKDELLFVTHHDAFPGSPGANDNASAIAVLIGLLKKRKAAACIFDEEEKGYVGASAYTEKNKLPNTVIGLELMGMGDTIAIWETPEERPKLKKIHSVLGKAGIPYEDITRVPGFWGDHTAFQEAGLKDSWCLTLAHAKERKLLITLAKRPYLAPFLLFFKKMPKLFKHYHNPQDTSDVLSEKSLQTSLKAATAVYDALHR